METRLPITHVEVEAFVTDIYNKRDELKLRNIYLVACPLSASRRNKLLALVQPFLPWNQFRHWGLLIDDKCYELRWVAENSVGLDTSSWGTRGLIFCYQEFAGWTQKTDDEILNAATQSAKLYTNQGYSLENDLNCHGYATDLYDAVVYRPDLYIGRHALPMNISTVLGNAANMGITFACTFICFNALYILIYQNLWMALTYTLLTAGTGIYINSILPGGQNMATEAKILRNILFQYFSKFHADMRKAEKILLRKPSAER